MDEHYLGRRGLHRGLGRGRLGGFIVERFLFGFGVDPETKNREEMLQNHDYKLHLKTQFPSMLLTWLQERPVAEVCELWL